MTQATSDAIAAGEGGRRWAWAFWSAVALLAAGAMVPLLVPGWGRWAAETFDGLRRPLLDVIAAVAPDALQSLVMKGAQVFLTPWLYVLMMVVFLAEKYIPADSRQRVFSVGLVQDFVAWFTLDILLRTGAKIVVLASLKLVFDRYLGVLTIEPTAGWPTALRIVAAVLAMDLLNWFHHFVRHKVKVFWLFHTVHHSQRELNMFTDLRVHFVEHLIAKPITWIPMFMLGLPMEPIVWIVLVTEAHTRAYHANIRSHYGWLRYVLVTPQSHRIHHSSDPRHADRNFGVLFSVWDRLFGTQWHDCDEYPATGVGDAGFPVEQDVGGMRILSNYFRQLIYPFRVLLRGLSGRGWELEPAGGTGDDQTRKRRADPAA